MTRNQIVGGVGGAVLGVAGAAIINGGLASPWALLGTLAAAVIVIPLFLFLFGPGLKYPRVLAE